ncbi:MAG: alkaline phosphatase family protein [Nitrospirae bacterium]|nr:alkaline phosphatase family protein [Nitrospirota bacterium]
MSRIVIIGIDGFDPFLLEQWKGVLPNLSTMFNDVSEIINDSTFPPDSICAWTSIYTGENPAEHGLMESIDYLSSRKSENGVDRSASFRGKTFWDIASSNGKKVCIINPFMAYPAWKINGTMVSGPVFEGGATSTYPDDLLSKYEFPALGGMVDYPDEKELNEFIERTKEVTKQLADAGLRLYKDQNPDLFFITFLTLDRIKHFLWRFTDEGDVFYPGENPLKDSIKEFYLIFDDIIGKYKKLMPEDAVLLVISDHGHRKRCTKSLNLNEILRANGHLAVSGNGFKKIIEKTKVLTLTALSKYGLQDWIYKIAKFVPNRKALKKSTYLIDRGGSSVTLSNLCGANPFGGVDITETGDEEYEKLRDNIISELMSLNQTLGEDIVKWVKRREQIYRGTYEKRLPDVLFELDGEYGVGMDLFTPPVTPNYTHRKISGGHKKEAVLIVHCNKNSGINIERPKSVIQLKDYILKVMNIEN